jgi:hypothetical protein
VSDISEIRDRLRGWLERRRLSQNGREDDAHFESELDYCDDMIFDTCREFMTANDFGILPLQGRSERDQLYRWMCAEEKYVAGKFDDQRNGHDQEMAEHHFHDDGFWLRQIVQYYDRARVFFDAAQEEHGETKRHLEMRGQQAVVKAMMTAKGAVESTIRVFGNLPEPGHSSGEVRAWEPPQ